MDEESGADLRRAGEYEVGIVDGKGGAVGTHGQPVEAEFDRFITTGEKKAQAYPAELDTIAMASL